MEYELIEVRLSHLLPSKRNPRRVKPSKEAHSRLVAMIRSQGLIQPLPVRPYVGKPKYFEVIAGERRRLALRDIHRDDDPKIPCILRKVDETTANAIALGENFGREAMHPLDEAEAFANLAMSDGKDANAISAEFGVPERYVNQRMKLATLAKPIKVAYREGAIDTGMAEAFTSVPEDRQLEVWKEVSEHPQSAEHVRNVIANKWIDASRALFDVSTISPSAVTSDLFSEQVFIERQAFMDAQAKALEVKREASAEEGWREVVVGQRSDIQDRLYSMGTPGREFDEATAKKLNKLDERRKKLEKMAEDCGDDSKKLERLQKRFEDLETRERQIIEKAPEFFSEETKAIATVFLILDPDGNVHRENRIPRPSRSSSTRDNGHGEGASSKPKIPTSDDLSDRQLAATFTHQALAVREALLKNDAARKRVLALILHDKIRSEALSIRHEPNGTTLHASAGEDFKSAAYDRLQAKRGKLDPIATDRFADDYQGYERLGEFSSAKLDQLIDLLVVECITAHMQRRTELVHHLATELKVNLREFWHPDVAWLLSFQKIQLVHLAIELKGTVNSPSTDAKKTDLVNMLAKLFADAAEGKLDDKQLEKRINQWLPSNMRELEVKE
jgi:ParB family chromosome partitioning protein